MTYEAKNNLMHTIQTVLLSLCTSSAIGCFILLWNLNNFATTQAEKNKQYDGDIITLNAQVNLLNSEIIDLQKQINYNSTRIAILETESNKK